MPVTDVAFIMYPVKDIQRSKEFYGATLGLPQKGMDEAWWVEFDVGAATFGIGNIPNHGEPGTAQSLVLEVSDLPAFRDRLTAQNVQSSEPMETPFHCLISVLEDPDGNKVWLHEKLKH